MREGEIFCDVLDEACELDHRIKAEQERLKELKERIRVHAKTMNPASGSVVTVVGHRHRARVTFPHDSLRLRSDVSPNQVKRLVALLEDNIVELTEGIRLRENVTLSRVRQKLGDVFDMFFEEDLAVSFHLENFAKWLRTRRAQRTERDEINDMVQMTLERTPNVPRVSFKH